jgi:hypothetical protein
LQQGDCPISPTVNAFEFGRDDDTSPSRVDGNRGPTLDSFGGLDRDGLACDRLSEEAECRVDLGQRHHIIDRHIASQHSFGVWTERHRG